MPRVYLDTSAIMYTAFTNKIQKNSLSKRYGYGTISNYIINNASSHILKLLDRDVHTDYNAKKVRTYNLLGICKIMNSPIFAVRDSND